MRSNVLANFLIGLREGLEAGLVVAILAAYLGKLGRRDLLGRLWIGIGIAVAVSLGVGALLTWGPVGLTHAQQELLGGILSLLAVAMVTWMIFWMARHGAGLSAELRGRTDRALGGSWIAIVLLGALSVGREGIETALFVWANVSSGSDPVVGTASALVGIVTAVGLAWGIARGLVRIDLSAFFTWTAIFLVFVAAGVFAYGLHDLQEAGALPVLAAHAWDLGGVLPRSSWGGVLLGGIFNYTPSPTWIQVVGWIAYVAVTLGLYLRLLRGRGASPRGRASEPDARPVGSARPAAAAAGAA
ncbi:iron uptake transporter permease EfeU [Agromyces arachidis]|uniref:iron uptake transporter permease EfeU n=1 Tax=Agromyces arachidis TaxID=766966 RepID=UPI004055C95C